jgi:hypothetical protein
VRRCGRQQCVVRVPVEQYEPPTGLVPAGDGRTALTGTGGGRRPARRRECRRRRPRPATVPCRRRGRGGRTRPRCPG